MNLITHQNPISKIILQSANKLNLPINNVSFDDICNLDANLQTCDNFLNETTEEIEKRVLDEIEFNENEDESENDEDDIGSEKVDVCTEKEMKMYVFKIKEYFIAKIPDLVDSIVAVESKITNDCYNHQQSDIRDFFKKL